MTYITIVNVPGYLPDGMDEEPAEFDTAKDAWYALYHERIDDESNYPCPLCNDTMTHGPFGDCDDDSDAATALADMARRDEPGVCYLSTPGYDGDHDLGLAYSVVLKEES